MAVSASGRSKLLAHNGGSSGAGSVTDVSASGGSISDGGVVHDMKHSDSAAAIAVATVVFTISVVLLVFIMLKFYHAENVKSIE